MQICHFWVKSSCLGRKKWNYFTTDWWKQVYMAVFCSHHGPCMSLVTSSDSEVFVQVLHMLHHQTLTKPFCIIVCVYSYMYVWVHVQAWLFGYLWTVFVLLAAAWGPALRVALDAWALCMTFPGKGHRKQTHLHEEYRQNFSTLLSAMITSSSSRSLLYRSI